MMTIKELIRRLQFYDPNSIILIEDTSDEFGDKYLNSIFDVKRINIHITRNGAIDFPTPKRRPANGVGILLIQE